MLWPLTTTTLAAKDREQPLCNFSNVVVIYGLYCIMATDGATTSAATAAATAASTTSLATADADYCCRENNILLSEENIICCGQNSKHS